MSFVAIERTHTQPAANKGGTPVDGLRLASHRMRKNGPELLIIWVGEQLAASIGLVERRESVSLYLDQSGRAPRLAFRCDPSGQFIAARRLRGFSIHADARTSRKIMGISRYLWTVIPRENLAVEDGQVSFDIPQQVFFHGRELRPFRREGDFNQNTEMKSAE